MRGGEFKRRIEELGRTNGVTRAFRSEAREGQPRDPLLGARKATLKDLKKEIGPGLPNAMLRQLGLDKSDIE